MMNRAEQNWPDILMVDEVISTINQQAVLDFVQAMRETGRVFSALHLLEVR